MTKLKPHEENWLKENYQKQGRKECSKYLNISERSCRRLAANLNLTRPLTKPYNKLSEDQVNFVLNNYKTLGPTKCAEHLGITVGHVSKIGKHHNIEMDKKYLHSIFWENLNNVCIPEMAYVLGLLWADGTVSKYKVCINLVSNDMNCIENLFIKTGNWSKHFFKSKTHPNWQEQTVLTINNSKICDFLIKHDYSEKSFVTPTKILSIIPKHLHNFFWRGYFDGDGSIHLNKKASGAVLCFAGTFSQDWSETTALMRQLNINSFKIRHTVSKRKHKSSTFNLSSVGEINKLSNYLYPNLFFDNIGLNRKFLILKGIYNLKVNKTSKYPGIYFVKHKKLWKATVRIKQKHNNLGLFKTEELAILAKNEYIKSNKLDVPEIIMY